MVRYSKQAINNNIASLIVNGFNTADILDEFLSMKMQNDLSEGNYKQCDSLSPNYIRMNLLGNEVIDQRDFRIVYCNNKFKTPRLVVTLSPSCVLYAELVNGALQITINDKLTTTMVIRYHRAADIAMWMIRQKLKLDEYMEEWEDVLKKTSKKIKTNHMSQLAIKAIFTESVKDYPNLEYFFIEQKRRMRISVRLPNSKLGVYLDAWWGSYKEKLPKQIEDLKLLIQTHSNISINNYYVSNK